MQKISNIIRKYKLEQFIGLFWFVVITITIHILWRLWAYRLHYWPIADEMSNAGDYLAHIVFIQSKWFIINILGIDTTINGNIMYFSNDGHISVNSSCSGLKPIIQFVLLIILIPGPWKRKLWFIPMGVIIVHLTNLFRIIGLSIVTLNWPQHWQFSHDWLFRPFFYVIIFLMWVIWVEKISKRDKVTTSLCHD